MSIATGSNGKDSRIKEERQIMENRLLRLSHLALVAIWKLKRTKASKNWGTRVTSKVFHSGARSVQVAALCRFKDSCKVFVQKELPSYWTRSCSWRNILNVLRLQTSSCTGSPWFSLFGVDSISPHTIYDCKSHVSAQPVQSLLVETQIFFCWNNTKSVKRFLLAEMSAQKPNKKTWKVGALEWKVTFFLEQRKLCTHVLVWPIPPRQPWTQITISPLLRTSSLMADWIPHLIRRSTSSCQTVLLKSGFFSGKRKG